MSGSSRAKPVTIAGGFTSYPICRYLLLPVSVSAERSPLRLLASVNLTANRAGCADGPPPAGQGAAELPSTQPTNFTVCTDSCPVRELARLSQRRIRAGHVVSLPGWPVISVDSFQNIEDSICASRRSAQQLSAKQNGERVSSQHSAFLVVWNMQVRLFGGQISGWNV